MLIAEVCGSSWAQLESNAIQLTGVCVGGGGGAERLRKTRGTSRGLAPLMPAAGFGHFLPKSSGKTHTLPTIQPFSKRRVRIKKTDGRLLQAWLQAQEGRRDPADSQPVGNLRFLWSPLGLAEAARVPSFKAVAVEYNSSMLALRLGWGPEEESFMVGTREVLTGPITH